MQRKCFVLFPYEQIITFNYKILWKRGWPLNFISGIWYLPWVGHEPTTGICNPYQIDIFQYISFSLMLVEIFDVCWDFFLHCFKLCVIQHDWQFWSPSNHWSASEKKSSFLFWRNHKKILVLTLFLNTPTVSPSVKFTETHESQSVC